ncbi:hypothetical protein PVW46_27690 [Mameliella sp. AT18]|nr:hypothetical protein [Mameliella sp. AT18]
MKRAESANRLRGKRNWITLLPVLLAFLSIASVLAVLQAQEMAQMRVKGRLIAEHREAMDRRALDALTTGDLGLAMMGLDGGALPLDSTPIEMDFDGRRYELRLQDVEGLVDLYLAPPELLRAVGLPVDRILRVRRELAETEPLGRLSSLAQTMSRMRIEWGKEGMVTQLAPGAPSRGAISAKCDQPVSRIVLGQFFNRHRKIRR